MQTLRDYRFFAGEFETQDEQMEDIVLTWALNLHQGGVDHITGHLMAHTDAELAEATVTACGFDVSVDGHPSPMDAYGFTTADLARAFRRFRAERGERRALHTTAAECAQ